MQYKLVRDKQEGEKLNKDEYRQMLIVTAIDRLEELYSTDMRNQKRVYEILADLIELQPCISNTFLTTKRELSTMARHRKAQEVAAKLATEHGSYFDGVIQEIEDESSTV